ncbi:MAG TPA: methylated-DNA--[protein]-cysteine S-methyltransferase [Pirellulales bacterium]|jgi:methylated-DNA-[protein]-cysteine S-methyltransferase
MATTVFYRFIDSPLGRIYLQGDGQFLTGLYMPRHKHWQGPDSSLRQSNAAFTEVSEQLEEYFAGERNQFNVPVRLDGTPFQQRVWQELVRIPYGKTITYAQLAARVGKPTASRAVGNANGRNPVSIIVPCHRVIGADGKLTGYGGGVDKKEWLLAWERDKSAISKPAISRREHVA